MVSYDPLSTHPDTSLSWSFSASPHPHSLCLSSTDFVLPPYSTHHMVSPANPQKRKITYHGVVHADQLILGNSGLRRRGVTSVRVERVGVELDLELFFFFAKTNCQ